MRDEDKSRDELLVELRALRLVFETAANLITSVDEQGIIVDCNGRSQDVLGYARAELIGEHMGKIIHPDHHAKASASLAEIMVRGCSYDKQYKMVRKDGELIDVSINSSWAASPEAGGGRTICIIDDITERVHAASALRRSEVIVASSSDMLALLDRRCTFLHANETYARALGLSPQELVGRSAAELFADGTCDAELWPRAERCFAGEVVRREGWLELPALGRRYVQLTFSPYVADSGEISGLVVTGRDATERKRAEQDALEKERRFREVFEAVSEGILLADPEQRRFVMANRALCDLFGYSEEELLELAVPDIHPADDLPKVIDAFERQLRGELRLAPELPCKRKDGSVFHADISSVPVVFDGRRLLLGCFRDVTERRQLQAQLAQADRLSSMGMLAAGVAHELNNPLAYVLQNLESLNEDLPELFEAVRTYQARVRAAIGDAVVDSLVGDAALNSSPAALRDVEARFQRSLDGTRRIRNISRGLGTFSRVERDEPAPVSLTRVIEAALNMCHNELRCRARLVKNYGRVPPVMASEGRLSQVFLNLLVNAAHAMDDGAADTNTIRVRTWTEGGSACAEVRDTGRGVPSEHLAHLFEPFFTTKELGAGSGLGLAISKGIIESYGGTIAVESRPGAGTAFTVRLPLSSDEPVSASEARASTPGDRPRGRVLIVDDEQAIREVIARTLRGQDTVQAVGGEAARAILERDRDFDVILCDMMMPRVSGMELHAWLARTYPALARRLIFVTGGAFTPKAREYLKRVDNVTLEKPFGSGQLTQVVRAALRRVAREQGAPPT